MLDQKVAMWSNWCSNQEWCSICTDTVVKNKLEEKFYARCFLAISNLFHIIITRKTFPATELGKKYHWHTVTWLVLEFFSIDFIPNTHFTLKLDYYSINHHFTTAKISPLTFCSLRYQIFNSVLDFKPRHSLHRLFLNFLC